jgi:hypothetical protein
LWQFAIWCERTPLGRTLNDVPGLFAVIEVVHLAGLAVIGGMILLVDMRLLGLVLRRHAIADLARDAEPWVIGSLIVMIASGAALFMSEARKCFDSPAFWIKISALLLVTIYTFTIRRRLLARDERTVAPFTAKLVAIVSVALWATVGWGGRWIGFGG